MFTLVIGNRNYSSWSLRAWYLLRQLGVAFNEIRLPLDTEEFEREIGRYSPARRVPVLIDGDVHVWDTLAIAEYVAETHPGVWPEDRSARAWARAVCAEMHAGFDTLRAELPMNCRARGRRVHPSVAAQRDIARVRDIWSECRAAAGSEGSWLFGQFCAADAMYAPVASRFRTYGVELGRVEAEYVATVLSAPAYTQWLAHAEREPETISHEEVGG